MIRIQDKAGHTFFVNPRFGSEADALIDRLERIEEEPDLTVVKRNMVRSVFRLQVNGLSLYLKRYHSPGLAEALKSLVRPSRARSEWQAMLRLEEAGIPTAEPIFYGEKRCAGVLQSAVFAATAIRGARPFGTFVEEETDAGGWTEACKQQVYAGMAGMTADLHRANIRHGDFHLGNILVTRGPDGIPAIHLIDLHSVSFPGVLKRKDRILNLARLAEVLAGLDGGRDLDRLLERYLAAAPGFAPSVTALREEVMARQRRLMARRLKSRTRRCLLKSSEFSPAKADGFRINHRRTNPEEVILAALHEHDQVAEQDDPRLLHPVFKNKVTAVRPKGAATTLCVKEYRPKRRRLPWPFSEGRRAWIAGRGLEVRGIATPETVAWVRGHGREFLITRYHGGARSLHAYASACCEGLSPLESARWQRDLGRELTAFIKKIHSCGVHHKDLSEQNILVLEEEGDRQLVLIDCDTVTFRKTLPEAHLKKNLVQLGHMPDNIQVLARARFLEAYLGQGKTPQWRTWLAEINQGILARMTRKRRKFVRLQLPDPHPRPSRLKKGW